MTDAIVAAFEASEYAGRLAACRRALAARGLDAVLIFAQESQYYLFGYDATCDIVADYQYEEVAQKLLLDEEQQDFFKEHNPLALRDAAQRLLEAHERQLWENAVPATLDALEASILHIQGELE